MTAKPKLAAFTDAELDAIPRGDTCPGVNRLIIERLGEKFGRDSTFRLLDVPCGTGVFLGAVKRLFPNVTTTGIDILDHCDAADTFTQADLSQAVDLGGDFDAVTCISGIVEFGNLGNFLAAVRDSLADDGILLISNDNLQAMKDRLLYLIGGRYSQYKFDASPGRPTWKPVALDVLVRSLHNAGFDIINIRYTDPSTADRLWSAVAAPLYVIQRLTQKEHQLRPYRSMLSRHYVIECRPATPRTSAGSGT